jgi:hypothetical protein
MISKLYPLVVTEGRSLEVVQVKEVYEKTRTLKGFMKNFVPSVSLKEEV